MSHPTPDAERSTSSTGESGIPSPYLTAEEAAAYLRLDSIKQLYGIVERGHLKPFRGPRRRYRFTVAQLDVYLARETRPQEQQP